MTTLDVRDTSKAKASELTGLSILVVEDSWHVGNALKRLLQAFGGQVAGPVATVAEAEGLISKQLPDAVLVDLRLRDGEFASGLINRLHDRAIPVIVTTGYTVIPPATAAKTLAILQKPVDWADLLEALRPVIAQKTAR